MTPRSLGRNLRPEVSFEDEEKYLEVLKVTLDRLGISSKLAGWRPAGRGTHPRHPSLKVGDHKISMIGSLYRINRSKTPGAPALRNRVEAVVRYLQKTDAEQLPLLINR
jgi:hypothetical protein